ncbi:MAG: DUF397 domain-containing protein [Pseudonocardiaceae bacterium]
MTTTTTHERRTPAAGGWCKSSRSTPNGECVEINFDYPDGLVRIRDSKDRGKGPTISVTGEQWAILLDEFAGTVPAGSNGAVTVETSSSGTTLLRAISDGTTLSFTKAEWEGTPRWRPRPRVRLPRHVCAQDS